MYNKCRIYKNFTKLSKYFKSRLSQGIKLCLECSHLDVKPNLNITNNKSEFISKIIELDKSKLKIR